MRNRRLATFGPLIALMLTAGLTAPILHERFGPDRTAAVSAPPEAITILGAGDILVHPPAWRQAAADAAPGQGYDFGPVFERIRGVVSGADLALCHMEAPMGPGAPQDFPRFNAPTQLAGAVAAAGFDGCSTASNHSLDQGPAGVADNLAALDAAGLPHTGTARTPEEAAEPRIYPVKGVRVGHLSYTYGLNRGTATPPGKPWMANVIDIPAMLGAAARLRATGAEIVVLSVHWGVERQHEPSRQQIDGAKQLLASPDIDLIIGHHAHVVQPMERLGTKWVAYGVGNLFARHDFPVPANKEGVLPRFTFVRSPAGTWRVQRAEAVPIWLSLEPSLQVINLPDALHRMSRLDRRRHKYAAAHARILDHLGRRGAIAAGLTVVS